MRKSTGITRVAIADDSDIAATYLQRLLEQDSAIRVVGRAKTGAEALTMPERSIAQVLILDMLMPELGGLSVIRRLSAHIPVIAISSVPQSSAVAMEALALGAVAFFNKKDLSGEQEAQRLRQAVRQASGAAAKRPAKEVVFVVGSTGAILPLENLVRDLHGLALPILVLQHLPEGRDDTLPHVLGQSGTPARLANHGEALEPRIFVARSGRHIELDGQDRIRLFDGKPLDGHCPSGDILLASAARLGHRAIAVILSGLGNDGAQGAARLAEQGGRCFVQHPDDCQAPSMPRAALSASRKAQAVKAVHLGLAVRRAATDASA